MTTSAEQKVRIEQEVNAEFESMEEQLKQNVGVFDLLTYCGGIEQAIDRADSYLVSLRRHQRTATTTNSSAGW